MKNTISILLFVLSSFDTLSQEEFPELYSFKIPVSIDTRYISRDRSLVVVGDKHEICSIDAVTGKVLWTIRFKDKYGFRTCIDWSYDDGSGVIDIQAPGEESNTRRSIWLIARTGENIYEKTSAQEKKQRNTTSSKKPRTTESTEPSPKNISGEGSLSREPNVQLRLQYDRFLITRNVDITVLCSGEYTWSTTVVGTYTRSLCTSTPLSNQLSDLVRVWATKDVVFVQYEGLSVLDLKTGKVLWETPFDYTLMEYRGIKTTQVIGRAPMPLVDSGVVYIANLAKTVRKIRKHDLYTGEILWESEELPRKTVIAEMFLDGDLLMVKSGGTVNVQTLTSKKGGGVCINEYKSAGDFRMTAYSPSEGTIVWDSPNVKLLSVLIENVSNLVMDDASYYFTSDKAAFSLDPKTGNVNWRRDLSKLKIGTPVLILPLGDDLLIDGTKGVARIKRANGDVKYGTPTGKNLGWFSQGDVNYRWTGKSLLEKHQFIRFNIETGQIEGIIKNTHLPYFTEDGNEFLKLDLTKRILSRYKTN